MTWTKLHAACERIDTKSIFEQCRYSSNDPLELDDHQQNPLHILAWGNPDPALLKAVITCCPAAITDQDVHGDTCLHIACSYPGTDVKVVKQLLDICPTLASMTNKEGLMPLHVACRFAPQNSHVIGYLMEVYPAALRSRIKMGNPAPRRKHLHSTSPQQEQHADHLLAREGSNFSELRFQDMSMQIRDGAYPIHMALAAGATLDVIEIMIKAADDSVLMCNKYGESPLHVALSSPVEDEVIELLTNQGGNALHIKDKTHKNLPIHVAAMHGCSVRVAKALLEHYMQSIHEENSDGKTPMELALEAGKCSEAVLRLLEITDDSEV